MLKKLTIAFISFRIVYSSVLTGLQYFTWRNNEFSRLFLPPHQPISYFARYSFAHFWLGIFLGVAAAFSFYFFLKTAGKFFTPRSHLEAELPSDSKIGLLGVLIVGWPNFIIFVVVALLSAVILSSYWGIIYKKTNIGLFWPFIIATIVALFLGNYLINFFHLGVLRI